MAATVVLMSSSVRWVLILLLILLLLGAISFLIVKEKNRKDRAAQRAAERKAIRDKVLEEARSGNAEAFGNMSFRPGTKAPLTSEDSMRLAKLERLESDLNALQSKVSTDSRRFSTTELNIAEASGEVVAQEGADDLSVGIAALANGESPVDFRHLASQLQDAEEKEAELEAIKAPEEPQEKEPELAVEMEEKASAEEDAANQAPKKTPAVAASLQAVATWTEKAEIDEAEEAAEEVPEYTPFTDTEDDFEELVFAPIREEVKEEESDFKPYHDEYEDLVEDDDMAAKEAYVESIIAQAPVQEVQPNLSQTIIYDRPESTAAAGTAPEEPAISDPVTVIPTEPETAPEEPTAEEIKAEAIEAEDVAPVNEEPASEPLKPSLEDILDSLAFDTVEEDAPEVTEAFDDITLMAKPIREQEAEMLSPKKTAPLSEEMVLEAEETDISAVFQAPKEEAPQKMYDTMGFTMSLETQKLSDEERRAAREARLAEKAKYAAALAGEGDYMPEEELDEDYDEDLDLEEEEGISVGRVILWILAAILSLVCVGAILYLLFGSFLRPASAMMPGEVTGRFLEALSRIVQVS